MPKFMYASSDGTWKMKRELKVVQPVKKQQQYTGNNMMSSSTSSINTDSSLRDVSIESDKRVITMPIQEILKQEINQHSTKTMTQKPIIAQMPQSRHVNLPITRVSETDEDLLSKSNNPHEHLPSQPTPLKPVIVNCPRNRHSMLVSINKSGFTDIKQVAKLLTQLYKQNDRSQSSLVQHQQLIVQEANESEDDDMSKGEKEADLQQILSSSTQQILSSSQQPDSNKTSQPSLNTFKSLLYPPVPKVFNQSAHAQGNHLLKPPNLLNNQRGRNSTHKARLNKGGISSQNSDEQLSGRHKSPLSGFIETTKKTSQEFESQERLLTQSQRVQQRRRVTNSPLKFTQQNQPLDVLAEIGYLERLYRHVYQPCKSRPAPANFYHAGTIKEATEDLEQSSKGGSIAFKSKNLFLNKANSIISQKDFNLLAIENASSPYFKQSLSIKNGKIKTNTNEHGQESIEDLSDINLSPINKDKRFSNPDPNDRRLRRLETVLAQKNQKSKTLIKQMTQEVGSKPFEDLPDENRSLSKPQSQDSHSQQNLQDSTLKDTRGVLITASPSHNQQSPSTAQLRGSKSKSGSGCKQVQEQAVQEVSEEYRFAIGGRGQGLIRSVKQVVRKFSVAPDQGPSQHLRAIMELTRKKVYLENIEQPDKKLQQIQKQINQQLQDLAILAHQEYQAKDESTPSTFKHGIRLSFETAQQNPIVFPDGYNHYQDDFTPSYCYMVEPVSSSSDLFSSANNFLSQLEPFNPNNFEMHPIENSSMASHNLTSLNQTSMYRQGNTPQRNHSFQKQSSTPQPQTQKTKILPDSFSQINMLLQDNRKVNESQRSEPKPFLISRGDQEESHSGFVELSQAAQKNRNEITLKQPSRRHTSSNSLTEHSENETALIQGSIDKTLSQSTSPLQNIVKRQTQQAPPLDLHPEFIKFLTKDEMKKLSSYIPRQSNNTLTEHKISNELSRKKLYPIVEPADDADILIKSPTLGQQKIITSVSKNVNKRLQRAITTATDEQYAARRRSHANNMHSLCQSQQMSPKKPHQSITTTSMVSSKQRGITRINQYQMMQKIGQGKFAKVKLCVDMNTNKYYAVKIMDKMKLQKKVVGQNKNAFANVQQEMAIMKKLDHPYIVKLYEIIDDPQEKKLYLITELVKKGNLEKKVKQSPHWMFETENDLMRKIFRQLITAMEYCHDVVKILHRDIKPENILIDENDDMKLGDFGVSYMLPLDGTDLTTTNAGSAIFFSPEACQGKQYHGRLADYWACGITLYFMCTGRYPFVSNDYQVLFKMIQFQKLILPEHIETSSLGDLIKGILEKKPEERFTLKQIKLHPWFTKNGSLLDLNDMELPAFVQPSVDEVKNLFQQVQKQVKYSVKQIRRIDSKSIN